jgi:hypothetical protein
VVRQYSAGNTEEQCKEAARLLALPDLELGMYTLCVFTVHCTDKFQTDAHWFFYLWTLFLMRIGFFYLLTLFPMHIGFFYLLTLFPMRISFIFNL